MPDYNIIKCSPRKYNGQRARIREIDILRGIAIILMITGHSFIVHPIDISTTPWCVAMNHWIYTFHMELFFLLAGCVYHCSNYWKYINKKIDRLIVPYMFFGFITLLLHSTGLEVINKHTSFVAGLIKLFIQGGSYWFLYTLFILYLIYPLIERICNTLWMEVCVAVICLLLYEFFKLPNTFEISRVVYYIPYFVLGRCLVKLLQSEKKNQLWLNILLLVLSFGVYIGSDKLYELYPDMVIIKYVRAMAMIFTIYVPVHYLLRWKKYSNSIGRLFERFLNNCSKYSLQLYLLNGFILVAARTLLVLVLHIHQPVIIVSLIVIANLLVTLLFCNFILSRTRWLAWLCGTGVRPWA